LNPLAWKYYPEIMVKRFAELHTANPDVGVAHFKAAMVLPTNSMGCLLLARAAYQAMGDAAREMCKALITRAFDEQTEVIWSYYDFDFQRRNDIEDERMGWVLKHFPEGAKESILNYYPRQARANMFYGRSLAVETKVVNTYGQDAVPVALFMMDKSPTDTYRFAATQKAFKLIENYDLK